MKMIKHQYCHLLKRKFPFHFIHLAPAVASAAVTGFSVPSVGVTASADSLAFSSCLAAIAPSAAANLAAFASLPAAVDGAEAFNAARSAAAYASASLASYAATLASSSALAAAAALIAFPAAADASAAISPASLVVDTPYFGAKDFGAGPIILSLLSPGIGSPPSMADA